MAISWGADVLAPAGMQRSHRRIAPSARASHLRQSRPWVVLSSAPLELPARDRLARMDPRGDDSPIAVILSIAPMPPAPDSAPFDPNLLSSSSLVAPSHQALATGQVPRLHRIARRHGRLRVPS